VKKKALKKVFNVKFFQRIISIILVLLYFSNQVAFAASEIVGSNNVAAPTITNTGNIYDVTTQKYINGSGVNSFEKFNVDTGDIANLRFDADRLINLIYDSSASQINGEVNAFKNGIIGGNVVFANSNGFVVGSTGVLNVGSLTLTTPTKAAMDDVFTKDLLGQSIVDGTKLNKIMNLETETSDTGTIKFNGTVNSIRGVGMMGSDIKIETTANINANRNLDMTDAFVNIANTATGIAAVENGKIIIKAVSSPDAETASSDNTVEIAGKINANKADIDISAYSDINGKSAIVNVNSGADIKGNNVSISAFNEVKAKSKSTGTGVNLKDFDLDDLSLADLLNSKNSTATAKIIIDSGSIITAVKNPKKAPVKTNFINAVKYADSVWTRTLILITKIPRRSGCLLRNGAKLFPEESQAPVPSTNGNSRLPSNNPA